MGPALSISVEEYLRTSYRPDRDYIEDHLEERNVGKRDHSAVQGALVGYLYQRRGEWGIRIYPEQRLQVGPRRYRVPDVCVVLGDKPPDDVFTEAPLLCVEVFSDEDRLSRMQRRFDDYFAMGVPHVWLLDPEDRRAWVCRPEGLFEARDGYLRAPGTPIEVPLGEIFSALD